MSRGSKEEIFGERVFRGKCTFFGKAVFKNNTPYEEGKWYAYTPTFTGFGTVSGVDFWWKREGASLKGWGKFTSGTSTAVEARISLPLSLTTDASVIAAIRMAPGMWDAVSASYATGTIPIVLIESGVGYVTLGFIGSGAGHSKGNANTLISNGQVMSIWFEVAISGWN